MSGSHSVDYTSCRTSRVEVVPHMDSEGHLLPVGDLDTFGPGCRLRLDVITRVCSGRVGCGTTSLCLPRTSVPIPSLPWGVANPYSVRSLRSSKKRRNWGGNRPAGWSPLLSQCHTVSRPTLRRRTVAAVCARRDPPVARLPRPGRHPLRGESVASSVGPSFGPRTLRLTRGFPDARA